MHTGRRHVGNAAYGLFAALIVLLAFLPTGISATRQTISAYALSPQGDLLRLAFSCLAVGSVLAAYEFWRSVPGAWGRVLATLTAVWVSGDVIDTVVEVNPVGGSTLHGSVHQVVAVVSFSAVAGTVIVFLAWLGRQLPSRLHQLAGCASVLALGTVVGELAVTALSVTSLSGTAERTFFAAALVWMIAARSTVAPPARSRASRHRTPRSAPAHSGPPGCPGAQPRTRPRPAPPR